MQFNSDVDYLEYAPTPQVKGPISDKTALTSDQLEGGFPVNPSD